MGDRTKYNIKFYLEDLHLDTFKGYCKWLHNNELPQTNTYCPDCNSQIYDNLTLNTWICYRCFRTFTKEEIMELDPNSKYCELCKTKIMWWAEVCNSCDKKQYKFGRFIQEKFHFILRKVYCIQESLLNYKWSFYKYKYKEEQLKRIRKIVPYFKRFEELIKNVDIYFDKYQQPKEPEGEIRSEKRWEKRQQNDIKFGVKILKKEQELNKKLIKGDIN